MTPTAIELAKRLGAKLTERKLWKPGMRWIDPTAPRGYIGEGRFDDYDRCEADPVEYPDLDDWATVGCLLGLLEEERKKRGSDWGLTLIVPDSNSMSEAFVESGDYDLVTA